MQLLVATPAAADPDGWRPKSYTAADGLTLPYRLRLPDDHDPKRQYPLVLFLHGAGQRGSDNLAQLKLGVNGFLSAENRKRHPCILVAPQCPADRKWTDTNWQSADPKQTPEMSRPLRAVLGLLDSVRAEHAVDPKRVYVCGVSMGASATWDLITRRPELFAAAVPVCGGVDAAGARKLAGLPVWAFQGAKDEQVRPELPRAMVAAVRRGGSDIRYTEYPNVGHDAWTPAYADPEMYRWLFAQARQ